MSIVELVRSCVIPCHKPAIYISGGLDSSIVLHHVRELIDDDIYTYTARFGLDGDETRFAEMLAEHYGTKHKTVDIIDYIPRLPEILEGMSHPFFNVWFYLLGEQAVKDGRRTVYIGEGADERFGGYESKSYIDAWGDHLVYVMPVYYQIHKKLGIHLEAPFERLDWRECLKWYAPPTKAVLKEAYRDILPNFIIERRKTPPAYINYWQLWKLSICKYFPNYHPKSIYDVRECLKYLATEAWLNANKKKFGF